MEAHDVAEKGLGALAGVELRAPEGFAERVAAAAERRGRRGRPRELRGTGMRSWARRHSRLGRRAFASSAIVAAALAVGLEARHLRRSREVEAA